MKIAISFILTGSLFYFLSCSNFSEPRSISGIWSVVEDDSIYYEVIFTNNRYWSFSEDFGELHRRYWIANDTINYISQKNNQSYIKSKISWISKDEFNLEEYIVNNQSDYDKTEVATHYLRISISIDTTLLLNGNEEELDIYYKGLQKRMSIWMEKNH